MKSVQKNVKINGLGCVYSSLKDIHKPSTVYIQKFESYVNNKTGRGYQKEWQESKWSLYRKTSNLKGITQTPGEEFPIVRKWGR